MRFPGRRCAGATAVDPFGFAILIGSVALSGLNGVVLQSQLQRGGTGVAFSAPGPGAHPKPGGSVHPIVLTWEIAPWAALTALAFGPPPLPLLPLLPLPPVGGAVAGLIKGSMSLYLSVGSRGVRV